MRRLSWSMGIGMLAACLVITGCNKAPVADFSADVTLGNAPLTVQFRDISAPGDSPITAWHWIFGDGAESAEQNPSHVYTTLGTHNVSLEVTSSAGNNTKLRFNFILVTALEAGDSETVMLPGETPLEMLWIPGGTFMMGRYPGEKDSYATEDPHSVTLEGYWMSKDALTKRQWQAVMGTAPWTGQPNVLTSLESPAVYVSWDDAQDFLDVIGVLTGKAFRLPSEAEWEYACRSGTTTRFYWGDDLGYTAIGDYAWYLDNCSVEKYAHLVGQKLPNAFGLHDMCGNVWEWCEDDWHGNYTGAPTGGQAWMDSPRGLNRVLRGGSWKSSGIQCRSAFRANTSPSYTVYDIGFRVVWTP